MIFIKKGISLKYLVFTKNLTNKWKGIEFDFKAIYENSFIKVNSINQDDLNMKLENISSIKSNYSLFKKDICFFLASLGKISFSSDNGVFLNWLNIFLCNM